ncbi:MAG TPA: Gfo/Idh/MocA family oxidoreductase [Kiritimatiellia bacterium]|nr:Gfo/Idh/MocA family oxidoreductase [Kiritimatiellia bacterium]
MMTRRTCLTHAAAAATLAALPRISSGQDAAAKPKTRIKVGQLGIGHNHGAAKMASFLKLKEDYEVVGVVEPDAEWREKRKNEKAYKGLRWMTEAELFAVPGLQLVSVETDVPDLTVTALRCIRAGFHVHLDKPGDPSFKRFSELLDEAGKRKLAVQMAYMFRGNPAFQFCIKAVKEGLLGRVYAVHAEMSRGLWEEYRKWVCQFKGGNTFIFGSHLVDLVVSMLGEPQRITPYLTRTDPSFENSDTGLVVMEYPRCVASIRTSALDYDAEKRRHLCVSGDKGTIEIRPLEPTTLRLSLKEDRAPYKKGTHTLEFPAMIDRYSNQLLELARVIRGEIANPYSLDHERLVQKCVLLASGVPLDIS